MGTRGTGGRGQRFSLRHFLPPRVTPELGVPGRVGRGRGRCGGEKPARLHLRAAPGSGSVLPRASWSWGRRRRDLHEGRCPRGLPARSSWARGHGRVSAWARACASPAGRRREREVTERRGGTRQPVTLPLAATSRAGGVPGAVSLGGSHLRLHCHRPLTSNRQHPRPRGASAGQPCGRQFPSRRRRDPGRLPLVPRLSQAFRRRVSSHRPFKTSSVVRPAAGTCHLRCERSTSIPMSETEGMS